MTEDSKIKTMEEIHKLVEDDYEIYSTATDTLIKEVKKIHGVVGQKFDLEEKIQNCVNKKFKDAEESKDSKKKEKNTKSEQQINEILQRLEYGAQIEINNANKREEKFKVPSLRFEEITKTPYKSMQYEIETLAKEIEDTYGITVKLVENVDIKNNPKDKFYIQLKDTNGNSTTIDLLNYQENIYNFEVDEEESVKNEVVKLKGTYSEQVIKASKKIAKYISLALGYKQTFDYRYKFVGWDSISLENANEKCTIFKYDKIYSNRKLPLKGFCGEEWSEAILYDYNMEDEKLFNLFFAHTFNKKPKADVILCAGVSGLIRQALTYNKETNININIQAKPGSGKSTIQHLVLSFFGDPSELEGSFSDSDSQTEKLRAERVIVPYMLDERMLQYEGGSDQKQALEILMNIFKDYEGKVKQRFGKQFEESGQKIYGSIISSSVESILDKIKKHYKNRDLGQYRRFIELDVEKGDLFNDGEHAKAADNLANNRYGYGVRQVVTYMFSLMKYEKFIGELLSIKNNEEYNNISVEDTFNVVNLVMEIYDGKYSKEDLGYRCIIKAIENYIEDVEKRNKIYALLDDSESITDGNCLEMYDALFAQTNLEVKRKLKEFKGGQYYDDMESSSQRFALLALTGYIINMSISATQFNVPIISKYDDGKFYTNQNVNMDMDIDAMIDFLIENLYQKLDSAEIINKKIEETYEKYDFTKKIIEFYDWCNTNKDYFYIPNTNKRHIEKNLIGRYRKVNGNIEILIPDNKNRKITINKLLANLESNGEAFLEFEYNNGELQNDPVTKNYYNKLINFNSSLIAESNEVGEDKPQISNSGGLRGNTITFKTDAIEKARKELQSQEESTNETN